MTARSRSAHALVLGLVLAATTAIGSISAQTLDRLDAVSNKPFDETVRRLRYSFGGYGMTVVAALDYQQILKQMKAETGRGVVFEVLRRPWAKDILEHAPAAGLAMPLRVYVHERADEKVVVSYYRPSAMLGVHAGNGLRGLG